MQVLTQLWGWYGESDTQYTASGKGIEESKGWIMSQSKFNLVELAAQVHQSATVDATALAKSTIHRPLSVMHDSLSLAIVHHHP